MSRTPGAKNRVKLPRVDDAYGSVFLDAPLSSRQAAAADAMGTAFLLSEGVLQSAYLTNGFACRIIDSVAEEMTRAGFKLTGEKMNPKIEDRVQSRFEELKAMQAFCTAIKWARAFGGSAIIIGAKDGGDFTKPLNPEKIQAIEFLRVYDRFELSIVQKYEDVRKENYGRAEMWRVSPAVGGNPYEVHESRLFVFDGDPIPNRLRKQNTGWGASVLQKCLVELKRLGDGHRWANLLMQRSQQAVHGIPDLSSTLADPEGEKLVTKRIDVVDRVRNAQNTIVIDAAETYEVLTASLAGVPDLLDRFAEALSAVTGIPIYVLMGRSPGGLNSTGKSNESAWYATVENMQNSILKSPLDLLISYLILEGNEGQSDGNDYTIEFNPLAVPSDLEQADIDTKKQAAAKAKADTAQVYVSMGALDATEVREQLQDESDYAEFMDANLEPVPPAETLQIGAQEHQNELQQSALAEKPELEKPASGEKV